MCSSSHKSVDITTWTKLILMRLHRKSEINWSLFSRTTLNILHLLFTRISSYWFTFGQYLISFHSFLLRPCFNIIMLDMQSGVFFPFSCKLYRPIYWHFNILEHNRCFWLTSLKDLSLSQCYMSFLVEVWLKLNIYLVI